MITGSFNVPVLFLVFNRPDLTTRVWKEIAAIRPSKLFIAADGPRNTPEQLICEKTRHITEEVNWDCEVKRLYRSKNLGCKEAVSEAVTWFFQHVEEGIILEDDCLPGRYFFYYCKEMLEYFRYDEMVGHINGSNHLDMKHYPGNASFHFSKFAHIWGWATWRRVWINYKTDISENQDTKFKFESFSEKVYFWDKFRKTASGKINTWDYQYLSMLWEQNLKSIMPRQNLIQNIGFDSRATHGNIFNYGVRRYTRRKREEITEMIYPLHNEIDAVFDSILYRRLYKRIILSDIFLSYLYFMEIIIKPFLARRILKPIISNESIISRCILFVKGKLRVTVQN